MKSAKWRFIFWVLLLFFLVGCGTLEDIEGIDDIEILTSSIENDFDIDLFDLSNIELEITKKNGTTEVISLHENMIHASDLEKFSSPGTHTITINYLEHELTFVITMKFAELKTKLLEVYEVYETANDTGLSYEDWVESIKGEDGLSIVDATIDENGHLLLTLCDDSVIDAGLVIGLDGKEVVLRIEDNHLEWQYRGDVQWNALIELSSLIGPVGETGETGQEGPQGQDGKEVTFRMTDDDVEWQYIGDTTWNQLISVNTLIGPIGIGISDVSINLYGELIVTYTDETIVNLGQIYTHYLVQFKDSDGYLLDTQHLIYGENAVAPKDPTKEGHLFTGWDIEFINVTTNLVVTATYSIETYSVSFDSHGGSLCDDIININHGSTIELPIPVKDGFIFTGWYRSNLVTASPFYDDDLVKSNLDLYARWDAKDYQIQFIDDDASILSTQHITDQETVVQPMHPKRLGYSFIAWYEDQVYTALYDFKTPPTADTSIYAKWELDVYQIEYILPSSINDFDSQTTYTVHSDTFEILIPTQLGYVFDGWYIDSDYTGDPIVEIGIGSTGHLTLYSKWSLIEYTLTYELNGGVLGQETTITYTVLEHLFFYLPEPIKPGYTFVGWYLNPDLEGEMANLFSSLLYPGNHTFYAKWELAELDIIYYLDGGTNNINNPVSFTILSESLELFDPTKSGCNFLGWYVDGDFSSLPISEVPSGTSQSLYLYAQWEAIIYNIYYVLDGGNNHEDNLDTYNAQLEHVVLYEPEREGYTFLGWYDNALFENEPITTFESSSATDVTFYAKWELIEFDILYHLDGGTNDINNPNSFNTLSESIEILNATKEGYTFLGWYNNDEFEGNPISEVTAGTNHSYVLFAKWELTVYNITYYLNGGSNHPFNQISFTIFSEDIHIYEPDNQGHIFHGWYDNSEFTGEGMNLWVVYSGTSQNIELHAKWELIIYDATYHLDGGTNDPLNPANYWFSYENIELLDPTKTGYTFLGWYDNVEFIGSRIYWILGDTEQSLEFYAKWSLTNYEIFYHLGDGFNVDYNPMYYDMNDGFVYFYEPYNPGYTFLGWYDSSGIMIGYYEDWHIHSSLCEEIDLFAEYELIHYNIDYVLDGGTNSIDNIDTYNVVMEYLILNDPVREGYIFEGWYDNSYFDGSAISIIEINRFFIDDIIFYASWSVAP